MEARCAAFSGYLRCADVKLQISGVALTIYCVQQSSLSRISVLILEVSVNPPEVSDVVSQV